MGSADGCRLLSWIWSGSQSAELLAGERKVIEHGEHEVLVLALEGCIYAVGNICTHDEVWLDDGILHPDTCEIECPMQRGRFDHAPARPRASRPSGRVPSCTSFASKRTSSLSRCPERDVEAKVRGHFRSQHQSARS